MYTIATLTLDRNAQTKVLPCHKILLALKDRVKTEIYPLVESTILIPVTKPTAWVSEVALTYMRNGNLRICIDPWALNTTLQREHYTMPKLTDARIISKLDVREAFRHVQLNEQFIEYSHWSLLLDDIDGQGSRLA